MNISFLKLFHYNFLEICLYYKKDFKKTNILSKNLNIVYTKMRQDVLLQQRKRS